MNKTGNSRENTVKLLKYLILKEHNNHQESAKPSNRYCNKQWFVCFYSIKLIISVERSNDTLVYL